MTTHKRQLKGCTACALAMVAALMLLVARPAQAQKKTGTTVGQTLLIEPSARVAAMGNAGVTTANGAMSAYFNPGALGRLASSSAQFTHSLWMAGMTYNYAAAAVRLNDTNTLLLTVTAFQSGDMQVRTVDQPRGTGEQFSKDDLAFGLGYGLRITDRFSAGLKVKYHREQIWHSSLTALALDAGVLYQLPFGAYFGASLSNFGTRGRYDGRDLRISFDRDENEFGDNSDLPAELETERYPLPIYMRVGVGYPITLNAYNEINVVASAYHPNDNKESVSLGAEWSYLDAIFVRGGYQNLFLEEAQVNWSLGGGLQYGFGGYDLAFDYAWSDAGDLGAATRDIQRFTLGFSF
jgi:hypothetical protein